MADDRTQRPYRINELPARGAPSAAPAGGDPLAELARLIGQNDPFAEYGRDGSRRAAPPQPAGYPPQAPPLPPANFGARDYYNATAAPAAPPQGAVAYAPPAARQAYANPVYAGAEQYHSDHEATGYAATQPGYEPGYYPDEMQPDEEFYDDVPPPRRRVAVMAIAAVFALAVIGTAGAFGYRALFGSLGSGGPPPVIKADTSPSKIVPAAKTNDPQNNKLIYDRVADRAQNEKIVSREEQPVALNKPAGVINGQNGPGNAAQAQAVGSGIVGMEPKKVHTIAIYPDQAATTGNSPPPAAAIAAPAKQAPSPRAVSNPPSPAEPAPQRQTVVANAAPARQAGSGNAPLSLNPDAQASVPAKPAPQPMRTASAPPARAAAPLTRSIAPASVGGYAVQVSSQRSEAEAQAAFLSLQSKYPSQLGDKTPMIHRVDLGAKGIYFRAMVGPFANANEATDLCSALKAAGGSCLIQRN